MSLADDQWSLLHFIAVAQDNTTEAVQHLGGALEYLDKIDLVYREFIEGAGVVSPAAAAILLLNTHACFRAAVLFSMSGQLLPVFMVLRGVLESALYANAMVIDKELQTIWLQRHMDEECRNRCKNSFTIKKLFKYLAQAQNTEFTNAIKDQYEATIDFGAHPNNRSLLSKLRFEELEGGKHAVELAYLHGYLSTELRQCLVACAEIGIAGTFIALICAPKHSKLEELNTKVLALQAALPHFVAALGLSMGPPSE